MIAQIVHSWCATQLRCTLIAVHRRSSFPLFLCSLSNQEANVKGDMKEDRDRIDVKETLGNPGGSNYLFISR